MSYYAHADCQVVECEPRSNYRNTNVRAVRTDYPSQADSYLGEHHVEPIWEHELRPRLFDVTTAVVTPREELTGGHSNGPMLVFR